MDMTTTLLAQLWGPVLASVGIGFFVSKKYYIRIYRDLEKNVFSVLFFGMFAMTAGVAHVLVHNVWETMPQIIISFLGWALLVKGFVCTALPGVADQGGDWALKARVVPAAGGIALLVGLYLSWIGYVA